MLGMEGWGVRLGPTGSLLWELAGMHDAVRASFSKRSASIVEGAREKEGRFSQAVAERIVALASRRVLPKSDPSRSLAASREKWHSLVHPDRCILPRQQPPAQTELEISDFHSVFVVSSIMTREMAIGRVLSQNLGASLPLEKAVAQINARLAGDAREDRLIEGPRQTLCHPAIFHSEERILEHVIAGLGKGHPFTVEMPEGAINWCGSREMKAAASRNDRVRFVLLQGEKRPEGIRFRGADTKGSEVPRLELSSWAPTPAFHLLTKHPEGDLVVVVREVTHKGDFLERLGRLWGATLRATLAKRRQLTWKGRVIEVVREGMDGLVSRLREGLCGSKSIAFWDREGIGETLDRRVFSRRNGKSSIIELDEPVPTEILSDFIERRGASVFTLHEGTFHHHTRWTVAFYTPESDEFTLKGRRKSRTTRKSELIALLGEIAVVKPRPSLVASGMQLRIDFDYEEGGCYFKAGELVRVKAVNADSRVALEDGREISPAFSLWRPSVILKKFENCSPPVSHLIIQGLQLSLDELLALPWKKKLTILTAKHSSSSREQLAQELDELIRRVQVASFLHYSGKKGIEGGKDSTRSENKGPIKEIEEDPWNLLPSRRFWAAKILEKKKELPAPAPKLEWEILPLPRLKPRKPERLPQLRKTNSAPCKKQDLDGMTKD